MRKLIARLAGIALALLLCACQKPFQTSIELGVDHEKITLPSSLGGHCYITVVSNTKWNIALEPEVDWARLGTSSGSGTGYVLFEYDDNLDIEDRMVEIVVSTKNKSCRIPVTQKAE